MKKIIIFIVLITVAFTSGCGGTKVTRVRASEVMDLSGEWNDTDSRLTAEKMISDCLGQRWLMRYEINKKRPTVIVGKIKNRSHEHINVKTFVKDIERELINSGRVDFVANKQERQQIRAEKKDQKKHSSAHTAQSSNEELGAELMLIGSINSIVDQDEGRSVIYYQIDLELIEIESHKKIWIGNKKIKKFVNQYKSSF